MWVYTSAPSNVMPDIDASPTDMLAVDSPTTKLNKKVEIRNHKGAAAAGTAFAHIMSASVTDYMKNWSPEKVSEHNQLPNAASSSFLII